MNWKELNARPDHLTSLGLFELWDIVIWGECPVPSILRKPCQLEHAEAPEHHHWSKQLANKD